MPPSTPSHGLKASSHGRRAAQRIRDRTDAGSVLPLWPDELADRTKAGRLRLLALLRQALRTERGRGRAGHWTYNLTRHAALYAAYVDEVDAYVAVFGAAPAGHEVAPRVRNGSAAMPPQGGRTRQVHMRR